jgi:hypothetical protein
MSTEQTIFDYTFVVPHTTNLFFIAGGKQGYTTTSGSHPWQMTIYFDGVEINLSAGAGAVSDVVSVFAAAVGVAPGTHEVKLTWFGDTAIQLSRVNMLMLSTYK